MTCPYCSHPAKFVDNKEIYGKSYGTSSTKAWWCKGCDARVGVHQNDPNRPLGTMANKALRTKRMETHAMLDPIWRSGKEKRSRVYARLREYFGREIHVGEADAAMCAAIKVALTQMYPN